MALPAVTAAVTAYNAASTVRAALHSAMSQDWPTLEILVIDDASTDTTLSIIEAFATEYATPERPIRVLRQARNLGVAAARNRLIAEAKGELIAFFDDDDESTPDRIRRQYERLIAVESTHNGAVICHAARLQVFPDGRMRVEATMGTGAIVPHGAAVADRILFGRMSPGVAGSCAACSQLARRRTYLDVGGFRSELRRSEDTELNLRLALSGCAFAGVAEPLVKQTMTLGADKDLLADYAAYVAALAYHADYVASRGWLDFNAQWQAIRLAYLRSETNRVWYLAAYLMLRHPWKLIQRILWSLPASGTRRQYRNWHRTGVASGSGSGTTC